MSNILTGVRLAVKARLETVTVNNGYLTNLGFNVLTGWLNEVLEADKVPDQFALIQRAPGKVLERGPAAVKNPVGFFLMGLTRTSMEGYEDLLDEMELDLIKAFIPTPGVLPKGFPKGVTGFQLGAPEHFPPGKGQQHAGVLIPIHITTIIEDKPR